MYNINSKIKEVKVEVEALVEPHQTFEEVRGLLEASGQEIIKQTDKGFLVLTRTEKPSE